MTSRSPRLELAPGWTEALVVDTALRTVHAVERFHSYALTWLHD